MSDSKSKFPDLEELASMTSKLFRGVKNSVEEIIQDYKQKRAGSEEETPKKEEKKTKKED